MTIRIGSNIASLTAQRRLGEADSSLSNTFERLSSGQRINRASDDAAGLAIADDLNSKARVYNQAIRNGNDGISLLNITDSANEALSGIIVRIRELAEQSANGTYSNKQRDAIDNEAQSLKSEYVRISQTTSFNDIKLLDGSLSDGLRLQLGIGIEGSIHISSDAFVSGDVLSNGENSALSTLADSGNDRSKAVKLGDLNGDGILDLVTAGSEGGYYGGSVTIRLGLGNGNFASASSYCGTGLQSLALGDLNGDGILDIVTTGYTFDPYSFIVYGISEVRLGQGDGTFGTATTYTENANAVTLGDLNGDGFLDLVTAGYKDGGSASVRLGLGDGSFGNATSYTTAAPNNYAVSLGDLNGDGFLDLITAGSIGGYYGSSVTVRLGVGDGNFAAASSYSGDPSKSIVLGDLNGDGILDLVTTGYYVEPYTLIVSGKTSVRLGQGDGTFGTATTYTANSSSVTLGDLNGDGILDLVSAGYNYGGSVSLRLGLGDGSFGNATAHTLESPQNYAVSLGDLDGDGILDIVIAGNNSGYLEGRTSVLLGQTSLTPGAQTQDFLQDFSLRTKTGALQAMEILDDTLSNLAKKRGIIGAYQSRINIALNNLASSTENFKAAESRIRDADIAAETANLVRTQILQQAASSVLAQANQGPALALQLLR